MISRRSALDYRFGSRAALGVMAWYRTWERVIHPRTMQLVNGWLTVFWLLMVPTAWILGWLDSVTFVSLITIWALVAGHLGAWVASRSEAALHEDADVGEVVEELDAIERHLGVPTDRGR